MRVRWIRCYWLGWHRYEVWGWRSVARYWHGADTQRDLPCAVETLLLLRCESCHELKLRTVEGQWEWDGKNRDSEIDELRKMAGLE